VDLHPSLYNKKLIQGDKKLKSIVVYSDENFYYQAINTIESFRRVGENFKFLYFQIGFKKPVYIYGMEVRVVEIGVDLRLPSMALWKPVVLDKALDLVDEFVYIDIDAIVSKNFRWDTFFNKIKKIPYGCRLHETEWQYPIYWEIRDGVKYEYNESTLMKILDVESRSQSWVSTIVLGVNKECEDFIKIWKNICTDDTLIGENSRHYFQLGDETVYNVLLWKGKMSDYYETNLIIEPKEISTIIEIENNQIYKKMLEKENPLSYVHDSSLVHVYHQLKELNFRYTALNNLQNVT
jgi:hypothetical protein